MQTPLLDLIERKHVSKSTLSDFNVLYYHPKIGLAGEIGASWESNIKKYSEERIIFPVFDHHNFFKGFAYRTPSFKSFYDDGLNISQALYGLSVNYSNIQKKNYAVLVEGLFDCLKLYNDGIDNVLSGFGTNLTWDQMCLLTRICKFVFICYDPDDAGRSAAIKTAEILRKGDIMSVIVDLKDKDPDEFIDCYGRQTFIELCDSSLILQNSLRNEINQRI